MEVAGYQVRGSYFSAHFMWPLALGPGYYEGRIGGEEFKLPEGNPGWGGSHYWYCSTFITDPKFWNASTRTGPDQWRSVGTHEVRYPSLKALFYTSYPRQWWKSSAHRAMGFVDGSGRMIEDVDLMPPYIHGTAPYGELASPGIPGMHTVDGVHGRDVR